VEGVSATVTGVAIADLFAAINPKLERWKASLSADAGSRELIDRDSYANVGALGFAGLAAGQESCRSAGMVAGAVAVRASFVMSQSAQDEQIVFDRRERFEDDRQIEITAEGGRGPIGHVCAV